MVMMAPITYPLLLSSRVVSLTNSIKHELTDARYLQITYLSCFLFYGIAQLGWEISAFNFITTFVIGIVTQIVAVKITRQHLSSIKSALITILGLTILLRAGNAGVYAFAAFVAIASKFIIRYKGKHIINPANFGIITAILVTGSAWISPGQWGNTTVLLFMIGAAGMMVLLKVGRLDLALPFLLVFGGLEFFRSVVYQGWPIDFFWHKMFNGSLMLFTFFMITDPKSTPAHRKGRIIFSVVIAILSFVLSNYLFVQVAPVWALFFLSPITLLLDRIFPAQQFNWNLSNSKTK